MIEDLWSLSYKDISFKVSRSSQHIQDLIQRIKKWERQKFSKIKVDRRLLKTMRNFQESSQQLSRRLQYSNPRYQSQESKIIQDINDDRFSLKGGEC